MLLIHHFPVGVVVVDVDPVAFGNLFCDVDCYDLLALISFCAESVDSEGQHQEWMIADTVVAPIAVGLDLEIKHHTVLNFVDVMPLVAQLLPLMKSEPMSYLHVAR